MITMAEFRSMTREQRLEYLLERTNARMMAGAEAWLLTLPVGTPAPWPLPAAFKPAAPVITWRGAPLK